MQVKIIDPSEDPRWDQFIYDHKHGSIYHHSAWMEVIKRTYDYIPKYYILETAQGQIHSALPAFLIKSRLTGNRLVSLPFTPFCDVLVTDTSNNGVLIDFIKKEEDRYNARTFEIKTFRNFQIFEANRFQKRMQNKLHILPLDKDIEKIRKGFHRSCIQRSIRKAERNNLKIRRAEDARDLEKFYHLYVLTKRKHGVPPHRYLFFKNIWDVFRSKNFMELVLAEHEGKTIAGAMLFKYKDSYYYHFAASNKKFLRLRPNHLLLWAAIKQSHAEGYKYFNFGRSAADQTGLVSFKRRWGTREYDLPYFYYPGVRGIEAQEKQGLYFGLARKIIKGSPVSLLKMESKFLSRHLG